MDDAALFDVTVPVFRHYPRRIDALLAKLPDGHDTRLRARLAPHAFSAAEHLDTAFAILRREGIDIGKADFDGQHVYAAGFRF